MIGDIYVINGIGYVFILKSLEDYFLNNLFYVSKSEINIKSISLNSRELSKLHYDFSTLIVTIPSLRVDVILSHIYALSRNEVKRKIENGDLIINSKEMYFISYNLNEDDIISFKKCGKLKIGKVLRTTKSGNIVLEVFKYI